MLKPVLSPSKLLHIFLYWSLPCFLLSPSIFLPYSCPSNCDLVDWCCSYHVRSISIASSWSYQILTILMFYGFNRCTHNWWCLKRVFDLEDILYCVTVTSHPNPTPPPSFEAVYCYTVFAVAEGWLFLDIGWFVLFSWTIPLVKFHDSVPFRRTLIMLLLILVLVLMAGDCQMFLSLAKAELALAVLLSTSDVESPSAVILLPR